MGLRGGLLRAQRNCLYSLVSFGGGPSCGRRAGSNCACAPSHTHAGSDSLAPAAISPHAADPGNFVGRTSRGKRCGGFPAFNGRRIQKALRGSRASGLALKSLRIISHSSRARGRGEIIEHLYSLAGPAPHGSSLQAVCELPLPLPRNSTSSRFTCSACVQLIPCRPPFTTARRADLISLAVRTAEAAKGTIRSASP